MPAVALSRALHRHVCAQRGLSFPTEIRPSTALLRHRGLAILTKLQKK